MIAVVPSKLDVAAFAKSCYDDPLRWVAGAYPWGQIGPLQHHDGPDAWQFDFLERLTAHVQKGAFNGHDPVAPIRMAVSKGHGVGGSVVAAWLVNWIMSTRPHAQGTVTANTSAQLETKTWATIQRWTKLCITADWFPVNTERMYYTGHKESWSARRAVAVHDDCRPIIRRSRSREELLNGEARGRSRSATTRTSLRGGPLVSDEQVSTTRSLRSGFVSLRPGPPVRMIERLRQKISGRESIQRRTPEDDGASSARI